MVLGLHRLESLLRGQLFVVKERLDCFAILINPLRADEPSLAKNSIDPIGNPSCTIRPPPAAAPLPPGLRRNLKHCSLCSFAAYPSPFCSADKFAIAAIATAFDCRLPLAFAKEVSFANWICTLADASPKWRCEKLLEVVRCHVACVQLRGLVLPAGLAHTYSQRTVTVQQWSWLISAPRLINLVKNHNRSFVCRYGHDGGLIHRSANSAARWCLDPAGVNSSLNEAIHKSAQPDDKSGVGDFTL